MKRVKQLLFAALAVLAALMVFSFAACGSTPESSSAPASDDTGETKYVEGTVTDAAMDTVTIQTKDGRQISFATEGADMSGIADLAVGTDVEVFYTGIINGNDASTVKVVRLRETSAPAPTTIHGTILESDGSTLVLQPDGGGAALTFLVADADGSEANGLVVGDDVTVTYTGTISGTDTSGVTVTKLSQSTADAHSQQTATSAPAIPAHATPPTNEEQTIYGTITYSDGATLTIVTPDQLTYSFHVAGADANEANGLGEGDGVHVYYVGTLSGQDASNVRVTRLVQNPSDTGSNMQHKNGTNVLSGTITYADGATLVIDTPSGQELSFLIAGADSTGCNGIAEGAHINVYYTGMINGDDTSNVTVTKLTQ